MDSLIMKFGGSAVGTVTALTQVLSIVLHEHKRWTRLILVVSALDGVTDMLLEATQLARVSNQRGYRRIVSTLRTRHLALIEQLPLGAQERVSLQADIDQLLFDLLSACQTIASHPTSDNLSPEITDSIIGIGERLSARIIAALLRQNNLRGVAIDATDLIITDNVHGNARPNFELTQQRLQQILMPMLDRNIIPVITGFIATTTRGKTATLGRGGSDYTASIISVCVGTDEVWIWSDVDGMMSSDPREIDEARVIPELAYEEVAELAYFGARILHARMIKPLQQQQIPLRIKNIYKPQQPGTLIHNLVSEQTPTIKAVTSIQGLGFTSDRSGPVSKIIHLVNNSFLENIGSYADVMISSQSSSRSFLCFIIPTSAGMEAVDNLCQKLEKSLKLTQNGNGWTVKPVTIITIIGKQLNCHSGMIARILQSLNGISIIGLTQGATNCSLSIIVANKDAEITLNRVHNCILNNE